ncbi:MULTISPECIES: hypothetical protein [unclassified Pseudoalteromonas]|uniref:hypothetical protein n=1 Tax=unclassified Pseudoalteromonas TaxID=194690 RepID=UPI001BA9157B|nr:hypothetical protein [Pseudoalteromonas sp. M8]QUI69712.1 hypothetical protein GSF13_07870 [Pseudoalteromonas sp. M8]
MKTELLKYRHYLLVLFGLLLYMYVIEPLWYSVKEDIQEQVLLAQRTQKINYLVNSQKEIESNLSALLTSSAQIKDYVYPYSSESDFKLKAQSRVERLLTSLDCQVESVGWGGRDELIDKVEWYLDVRFRGTPDCALRFTREFESQTPLGRIKSYSYAGREVSGKPNNRMVIMLKLVFWQNNRETL